METSELLRQAWQAVKDSGVPESVHEVAFKEAIADIRSEGAAAPAARPPGQAGKKEPRQASSAKTSKTDASQDHGEGATPAVDEATFFQQLAGESGVAEKDLRDVLSLSGGNVHVTTPTRELGANTAEQAKTVIPLVAGARSFGLGERPVDAKSVRAELDRKRCLQPRKFAERHLGPLRGFNAGAKPSEIVTTSRWVDEFTAAVTRALGRPDKETES